MKSICIIKLGILSLLIGACCKEKNTNTNTSAPLNCVQLAESLNSADNVYAKVLIDSICQTLPAKKTNSDPFGHKINTDTLLFKLKSACSELTFELNCYACSKYEPLRSFITVNSKSIQTTFELEVENTFMKFYRK